MKLHRWCYLLALLVTMVGPAHADGGGGAILGLVVLPVVWGLPLLLVTRIAAGSFSKAWLGPLLGLSCAYFYTYLASDEYSAAVVVEMVYTAEAWLISFVLAFCAGLALRFARLLSKTNAELEGMEERFDTPKS